MLLQAPSPKIYTYARAVPSNKKKLDINTSITPVRGANFPLLHNIGRQIASAMYLKSIMVECQTRPPSGSSRILNRNTSHTLQPLLTQLWEALELDPVPINFLIHDRMESRRLWLLALIDELTVGNPVGLDALDCCLFATA